MKSLISFMAMVSLVMGALAQEPSASDYQWPQDWLGKWSGTLLLKKPGNKEAQAFPMQLHISETEDSNQWNWTIIYGEGEKADTRKYVLIAQEENPGHFVVDEKNSILLDQYLIGDNMLSRFAVDNTLLFASYRLEGDRMLTQITTGSLNEPRVSGEALTEEDGVESVRSFSLKIMQEAILYKK